MIQEKLDLSQIVTSQVTALVSLDNNRTIDFGSWGQFESERWHTSAVTKSVIITWDFNIQIPNYQFPQRHTVKLRMGSKLKPKDMFELVMNHEDEGQLRAAFAHSVCTIDFINPVVSSEIFLIIENWHNSLPQNFFTAKWQEVLRNNAKKIAQIIVFLVLVAGSTILFWLSKIYLNVIWTENFDKTFLSRIYAGLIVSSLFFIVFYQGGLLWADRTVRYINRIKPASLFKFTKGDTNANDENQKKNNKILKSIGLKMLITILFNFFAYFSQIILRFIVDLYSK